MDRSGAPPWTEVLAVFVQAGRGPAAAHDAGFVHCDFESRYVQRTDAGRVVVTDFGLTRARTRADGLTNVSVIDGWLESHAGGVRPGPLARILGR